LPLYEYECPQCGRFEKIAKFSDRPLKVCPTCGKKGVERLLSAPAIQFKGSGWYITDYARKAEGKPEAKGDGKGESKPDSKVDGQSASGEKSDGGGDKAASTSSSDSSKTSSTPKKDTSKKSAASSRRSP
jgi:putative FmdB family regulatory protein